MNEPLIKPRGLKPGDHVIVVSPSGLVERSRIETAIEILRSWGLKVSTGRHTFNHFNIFAGRDGERLSDLQSALDNKDFAAIFCTRGGYGISRIIYQLDFSGLRKHPKWLVGFSDITVLHSAINNQCGLCSMHAPVLNSFMSFSDNDDSLSRLRTALTSGTVKYSFPSHPLNRSGEARGILTGGNLSLIYNMRGTPCDINPESKILFIEDVGEYLYHLDRMMMNLKNGGILEKISGLICGGFTEMKDQDRPFGQTAEEIISEAVAPYSYPVIFGFPAGHMQPNYPLIMGAEVNISSQPDKSSITSY